MTARHQRGRHREQHSFEIVSLNYVKYMFIYLYNICIHIIFSKLIYLIYFNIFIEDFELVTLVSSLIYLVSFFFVLENKGFFNF